MTTKSVATKADSSKESKGIPLWIAGVAILLVILAALCLYLQTPSIWLFYKTQSIYGDLIAPVFFFVISLALLRNLWENRDKDKNDRVRRVVGLAVFGFFIVIGFTYSLDPNMSWFFYKLKDQQGNLIALVFFALLLLCGVWWGIEKSDKKQWAMESAALLGLFAMDFIYLVKTWAPGFFAIIQDKGVYLITPLFLLLAPAPLSFYLWLCRNEDKLRQIQQSDEQNRFNSFSNAIRLFLERDEKSKDNKKGKTSKHKDSNSHTKAVGLMLLAKIKSKSNAFDAEIDMATPGVNLDRGDLTNADLTNIDLSRAILTKAKLDNANLIGATLTGTNLTGAGMFGADLTKANLKDAILNDIVVGIYEDDFSKGNKRKKFSRTDIENYLKKDLEKRETPAQVKEKKGKKEIYYYFETVTGPTSSTTGTSLAEGSTSDPSDVPPTPSDSSPPSDSSSSGGSPPPPPTDLPPTPAGPSPTPTNLPPAPATAENASATRTDSSNQREMLHFPVRESDRPTHAAGGDADAYFNRGKTKLDSDDFDGAIKDFDKVIELDSNHAGAYRLRALAKMRKGME